MILQPPASRSTFEVAYWFQLRCDSAGESLPPQRLHYLLYLTHAHYAAEHRGRKIMPATFLATEVGPVEPNVHLLFDGGRLAVEATSPPGHVEDYLAEIWSRYGTKSVQQLQSLVDRDGAWRGVLRKGALLEIPVELLYRAYGGGADAVPLDQRSSARQNRNKEQEYWTLSGKRAERWTPGVSNSPAAAQPARSATVKPARPAAPKSASTGIRRILSAEEAQGKKGRAAPAKPATR